MPPNVDKMFSVNQPVWWRGTKDDHGQATMLSDHPPWEEARKLAGLDWDPIEEDLYRPPNLIQMREDFERIMFSAEMSPADQLDALTAAAYNASPIVEGWKHIHRSDAALATLACTQDTYQMITNSDFGGIFDAMLGQDNVKFVTGGCLEGGRKVWMLAKLDEPVNLPGEGKTLTVPHLALMARHDALGSVVLRATNVVIVCSNTFNAAELEGDRDVGTYRFIHKGHWRDRMDEARNAVLHVRAESKAYEALAVELLGVEVTKRIQRKFVNSFIPMPPKGDVSDTVIRHVDEARARLTNILGGPTVAGAGVGGTAYGLVQGAGEYLDHARRSRSWETKLNRSLLRPEPLKARALSIVRELTAV